MPDIELSADPNHLILNRRRRLLELPWKVGRRLRKIYIDCRWKWLGYDYISLLDDVRLKVHADGRLGEFLRYGDFEVAEQLFLKRFLRPGDVFVDAGANIGLYTLLAGRLVGPTGRVIAFEPCSTTFERLLENVHRSRMAQVECHRVALSNTTGQAILSVSRSGFDMWNSLAGSLADGDFDSEQISTVTWDDFNLRHAGQVKVAMMKIDVEGWEMPVLDGANAFLSGPDAPLLQVEFTPANAVAAGKSSEQLFDRIKRFGYKIYRYDVALGRLHEVASAPSEGHCNLYAAKCLDEIIKRMERTYA